MGSRRPSVVLNELHRIRIRENLTQERLAELAKTTSRTVQRAERMEPVAIDTAEALSRALRVPLSALTGDSLSETWRGDIENLLEKLFSQSELLRFVRNRSATAAFEHELVVMGPLAQMIHQLVALLDRHNLIKVELFWNLVAERPKRFAEISEVARSCGVRLVDDLVTRVRRVGVTPQPTCYVPLKGTPLPGGSRLVVAEEQLWTWASQGGPRLVLLLGGAGCGKSWTAASIVARTPGEDDPLVIPYDALEHGDISPDLTLDLGGARIRWNPSDRAMPKLVLREIAAYTRRSLVLVVDDFTALAPSDNTRLMQAWTKAMLTFALDLQATVVIASREEHYDTRPEIHRQLNPFRMAHPNCFHAILLQPMDLTSIRQLEQAYRRVAEESRPESVPDSLDFQAMIRPLSDGDSPITHPFHLRSLLDHFYIRGATDLVDGERTPLECMIEDELDYECEKLRLDKDLLRRCLMSLAHSEFTDSSRSTPISPRRSDIDTLSASEISMLSKVSLLKGGSRAARGARTNLQFRHRLIRDHFLAALVEADMRRGDLSLLKDRMLVRTVTHALRRSSDSHINQLLEDALFRGDWGGDSPFERNAWHLLYVFHAHSGHTAPSERLIGIASQRFAFHLGRLEAWWSEPYRDCREAALSSLGSCREAGLILDRWRPRKSGLYLDDYVVAVEGSAGLEWGLATLVAEYFGTVVHALDRIVAHIGCPKIYGRMVAVDLLQINLMLKHLLSGVIDVATRTRFLAPALKNAESSIRTSTSVHAVRLWKGARDQATSLAGRRT
jgi:transcriptional regulator with XRE-family HTH domain